MESNRDLEEKLRQVELKIDNITIDQLYKQNKKLQSSIEEYRNQRQIDLEYNKQYRKNVLIGSLVLYVCTCAAHMVLMFMYLNYIT